MKYIIELTPIEGTDLYRAKGANTLVFDENGIKNILMPYRKRKVKCWETYNGDFVKAERDFVGYCNPMDCLKCHFRAEANFPSCFVQWLMEEIEVEE